MALGTRDGKESRILVAVFVAAAVAGPGSFVRADLQGRRFVVPIAMPQQQGTVTVAAALVDALAEAASCGATDVALSADGIEPEAAEPISRLSGEAHRRGVRLWVAVDFPGKVAPAALDRLPLRQVGGVALIVPPPQGKTTQPGKLPALLDLKAKGDALGAKIRQIKGKLTKGQKLALCVAVSEILPETARDQYVPVNDLVRDGTLDVVCLSEAQGLNFHRLRLLRDAPLCAGVLLDARSAEPSRQAGLLERAALAAVANPTSECLWLAGFSRALVGQVVPSAVERHKQAQARQAALEKDIAAGELAVDRAVSEEGCNDQATVHGVAQSFVPSRDGLCPLVQIFAALRGCAGPLPPAPRVEIREDEDGKPGAAVLARTEIPAGDFGREPAYRWGSACFDPPVRLRGGVTYWIYLPDARRPEGSLVWRLVKDGAEAGRRAWSRAYDYSKHAWAFRIYLKKEP